LIRFSLSQTTVIEHASSGSSDREIRHFGRRARRQNPRTVSSKGKSEHAVEVNVFKAHRRQMTQYLSVDLTVTSGSPAIESGLHLMCIPRHDEVRNQCERTGLRAQLFGPTPASGATAGSPDLALQDMGSLVVVKKP
jgi:hypothetical protein